MNYTKAQIIEDVRRVIDENATSIRLNELSDIETLDLNQLIVATICDAAKAIESAAPLHLLDYTKPLSGAVEIDDGRIAYIDLPPDFMRMAVVNWGHLGRPIYKFISVDSPQYIEQQNKYVQGTIERPVGAIVMDVNVPKLEIYADGITQEGSQSIGDYVPIPAFEGDRIALCSRCYRSIIYRCAGMVLVIYKDNNAENLLKISESILI